MIISNENRYLFIEIPLTASWAIRHELCEYYGGEPVLHKHAAYPEFARVASDEEKDYVVFATVRNPLDVAVSRYFKLKTDHKEAFTDTDAARSLKADAADREKYRFVAEEGASFAAYFRRYHRRPFNTILDLSAGALDVVVRYEHLQDDFSHVLQQLGLEQVRPIPVRNKTAGEIIEQAKRTFGPYMRRWGYSFPPEWGPVSISWRDELAFRLVSKLQRLYLAHFRYGEGRVAKVARAVRAWLAR